MTSETVTIESLRAQLDSLGRYLAEGQFAALEAFFDEAAADWLDTPRRPYGYLWYAQRFLEGATPLADMIVQLGAWCRASPTAYHAHFFYGSAWEKAAGKIRSAYTADYVDEAQWVGAQMARDHAHVAYLQAIALHPRPALALHSMMRLSAYLGEGQWLVDLAQNRTSASHAEFQQSWSQQAWEGGLALLMTYGDALADIPSALPPGLPERAPGEFDDAKTYWLRLALKARPGDSDILGDYLYFLYPRWGGGHQEMEAFIEGPLCADLCDQERDELRYMKALDYLGYGDFPDADDTAQIEAYSREFEACLQLDLTANNRAHVRYLFANFQRRFARSETDDEVHWDDERMRRAYALMVESCEAAPAVMDLTGEAFPQTFNILTACLWFKGLSDTHHLLSHVLDRSARWGNNKEGLLLAALGSRFGLFGIEKGRYDHHAFLDQALAAGDPQINIAQLGRNIWESVSPEAALFLWEELAARGNSQGMMGMSQLYEGKISPDPSYIDDGLFYLWLRRAAEAGHHIARVNLVWRFIEENDTSSSAQYQEFKGWLEDVWENAEYGSRVESVSADTLARLLMLFSDNEEDKRANLDHVLAWLWAEDDDSDQFAAARSYAQCFLEGRGCTANRYLAKVWIDRALAIRPDDQLARELADRIYMKGELLGASKAALVFRRDRRRVDERAHHLTFGRGEPDFD